jgi:hypothetical protein
MAEMTEEERRFGRRWFWAMRRTYVIPDIVTDANATEYLASMFKAEADAPFVSDGVNVGGLALSLVLRLGWTGELDSVLLNPDADLRAMCVRAMQGGAAVGPEAIRATVTQAMKVAELVCQYVGENPQASEAPYPMTGDLWERL